MAEKPATNLGSPTLERAGRLADDVPDAITRISFVLSGTGSTDGTTAREKAAGQVADSVRTTPARCAGGEA
jgi:hypothetical protein